MTIDDSDGSCIKIRSARDVYDAIDLVHTRTIDEIEFLERLCKNESRDDVIDKLQTATHILESVMENLYDLIQKKSD